MANKNVSNYNHEDMQPVVSAKKRRRSSRRKRAWIVVCVCLCVVFLGVYSFYQANAQLKRAMGLKESVVRYGQNLLAQNPDGAQEALADSDAYILEIQDSLNDPFWKIAECVPFLGKHVTTARSVVELVGEASREIMEPAIRQVRQYPLAAGEQVTAQTAQSYLEFAVTVLPDAGEIVSSARALDLGLFDRGGKLSSLLLAADCAVRTAQAGSDTVLMPLLQHMQRYPLADLGLKEILDHKVLSGYVEVLDHSIPLIRDALAEIQESQLGVSDNQYLVSAEPLLNLLEDACSGLLYPLCDQLREYPATDVILDEGFNAAAISDYVAFAESVMPCAEQLLADMMELDVLTGNETVAHALLICNNLKAFYYQNEDMVEFVKMLLGDGEDRLYLLAAQNSAEIRASGGFPGAMGVLRIQDGVLTIGDFSGVNDVLAVYAPREAEITFDEYNLFQGQVNVCRDACYCPDFERVAYIWSLGYESKNGEKLDGVLSLTPVMIQRILSATDEILLSDGIKLTSENATRILQRDIYFQYFGQGADVTKTNALVDALFAETAKKAMASVVSGRDVQKILSYPDIIREGFAERTLMVWMAREEEQAFIRELGWDGGLNDDANAPEAGIYFSIIRACKMGWFMEITPEIGEPVVNDDGSMTYPITVTFQNTITKEEIKSAGSEYILGGDGRIRGAIYFFAPAGGTIGKLDIQGVGVIHSKYHDLQLEYIRCIDLLPGKPVRISYEVTTAPGVQTPLVLSQTPTLQAYH